MLPTTTAVGSKGSLHMEGVRNISIHMSRARAKGARVIFVIAKGDAGNVALYTALDDAGFLGEGYAVFEGKGDTLPLTMRVNGIVHMTAKERHECKAAQCPLTSKGQESRIMNQAHDAVYTLAKGLAPSFRDGGSDYLAGVPESRLAAMAAIRATSLSANIAASGLLEFDPYPSNLREKWNFEYVLTRCCEAGRTCTAPSVPVSSFRFHH